MEGDCDEKMRSLSRRSEVNRLEEEIWGLVYEQIWPVIRRAAKPRQSAPQEASKADVYTMARRA